MRCYRLGRCALSVNLPVVCRCVRLVAWRVVRDLLGLVALAALAAWVQA
jgi:hypothetical protein